ncbi:conjugal transfer protein TraH [Noviherbaspirillum galbum]|uniref:Conjugal transfer protein TraH n=1 Tax=Noviherbaspirillum galbum TaxID=2709383 RepID=A0A6B3SVI8_9BURK|nr:conjugal transfer protein TraH [Noviherbaspirillum galbum]NEX63405.1 hypothetical protein [Noviherbaspirillum galbum]
MAKARVKLVALLVTGSMIMGATRADIGSALDGMWYSSAGGAINGKQSMGLYGPSISLRSPNKVYQVAYFDPPRLAAGCAGVDMTLGSFTMFKVEAFKELVRKIMQGAPGFLLQLAVKAMCDDCSSILQTFQNLANVVNSGTMNSCRISQQLYSSLNKDLQSKDFGGANTKDTLESYQNAVTGYVEDVWGAMNNLFKDSKANRQQAQNTSTDYGNTLFNTFYTNGGPDRIDFAVLGGEQEGMQIVQSLIGTKVYKSVKQSDDDSTAASVNGPQTMDDGWYAETLTFDDIVRGFDSSAQKSYLKCVDFKADPFGCQKIDPNGAYNYRGIKRYLIEKFAGPQDGITIQDFDGADGPRLAMIGDGSIMDKYMKGDVLSADELALLRKTPLQVQRMLVMLAESDPATRLALLDEAFEVMSYTLASSIGMAIVKTVAGIYQPTTGSSEKRTIAMTDQQRANLGKLNQEAQAFAKVAERNEKVERLTQRILTSKIINSKFVTP